MMKIKLGRWVCPTGNSCEVTFEEDASPLDKLWIDWDCHPTPQEMAHYCAVIHPAVHAKAEALGLKARWSRPFRTGGVA